MEFIKVAEEKMKEKQALGVPIDDMTLLEVLLATEGLTRKDELTFMLDMFFAGIDTVYMKF